MPTKHWLTKALVPSILLSAPLGAIAGTEVVTSIKPLELLARAVAPDDTEISTLVPSGSSPHTYTMKPSQRRALASADVIFWVGPGLESFLARLLEGEEFRDRTIALGNLPANEEGTEEDHHHEHHNHGHEHHDGADPHVWLDPALALSMAEDIRDAMARVPGADQEALNRRLNTFRTSLHEAEEAIREKLEPLANTSLFTYHDAFRRYAEHYGLEVEGVLTLNPEISPGARHMQAVRQQLEKATNPCLLTEPQFPREWWRGLTSGIEVTLASWDPLAGDIDATASGYIDFQHDIADSVLRCLQD